MDDEITELVSAKRYSESLERLTQLIAHNPSDWEAHYWAGQCCRYLNDFSTAISYLSKAAELNHGDQRIYLSLGIAYQLKEKWLDSKNALRQALEIDPDYVLAYNSIALTQKKSGELEKAELNYDAGLQALGRVIVKSMDNSRETKVLKHRDTIGQLWTGYAMNSAMYLAACEEGIEGMAFPSGEMAIEEERSEQHGGLFWEDQLTNGSKTRLYLPNFFNTFLETLRTDTRYPQLLGNRGVVLEMLGRGEEASLHLNEAEEFQQRSNGPKDL